MKELILNTIRGYLKQTEATNKNSAEKTLEALLQLTLDNNGFDGRKADPQVEISHEGVFCSFMNEAGRLIIVQA